MSVNAYLDSPMFTASSEISGYQITLSSLLDPFAVSAFLEQTSFWTLQEKNTQLVALEGNLLANRVLWLTLSLIALFVSISSKRASNKRFSSASSDTQDKNFEIAKNVGKTSISTEKQKESSSSWLTFKHSFNVEFSSIFRSLPFGLLVLLTIVLLVGQFISAIELGSLVGAQHPYTSLLVPRIVLTLKIVSILTVAFYSAEIIHRAKEYYFFEVINATPASRWALYLSQLATLSILVLSLLFVAIFSAVAYQVVNGFYQIEWELYLSLVPIYALPMIYLAILSTTVHLIINNKYLGILIASTLMLVSATSVGNQVGLEHVLLKFSSLGTIRYSDFNGFDYTLQNIQAMLIHWGLVSAFLAFIGYSYFNAGLEHGKLSPLVKLRHTLSRSERKLLATTMALIGFFHLLRILEYQYS